MDLIDPAIVHAARQNAARIDASLSALIDRRGSQAPPATPHSPEPDLAIGPTDANQTQRALRLLLRIDSTLLRLAAS